MSKLGLKYTSGTVRPTSHNLQHRTKQFLQGSSRIASIGSVWFQFYNTFMGWAVARLRCRQ